MTDKPRIDVSTTDNVALNRLLHKQHMDKRPVSIVIQEGTLTVNLRGTVDPGKEYREDNDGQPWSLVQGSIHVGFCTFQTDDVVAAMPIDTTVCLVLGTQGMAEDLERKLNKDGVFKQQDMN